MLLIGSQAVEHHLPGRLGHCVDTDYIATYDQYTQHIESLGNAVAWTKPLSATTVVAQLNSGNMIEFMIAWPGTTNATMLHRAKKDNRNTATLEELLMLKLSHRYLRNSPHFLKTMSDIHFLRGNGMTLDYSLTKILKKRERETYTYAHPNLNTNKAAFFSGDGVDYVYEHDDIHEAVKVNDRPAYSYFMPEGNQVRPSKEMFFSLDLHTQLCAGLEESYVLAIERSLVPHPEKLTLRQAFDKALMKVCSSITSGWFREFCWEHYYEIRAMYDESYFDKFQLALSAGQISPAKKI